MQIASIVQCYHAKCAVIKCPMNDSVRNAVKCTMLPMPCPLCSAHTLFMSSTQCCPCHAPFALSTQHSCQVHSAAHAMPPLLCPHIIHVKYTVLPMPCPLCSAYTSFISSTQCCPCHAPFALPTHHSCQVHNAAHDVPPLLCPHIIHVKYTMLPMMCPLCSVHTSFMSSTQCCP